MVVIRVIFEISNKGVLHLNDWIEVAVRKIKQNGFHCRMIAYNKPDAYNKTFVQVCGIKIKDSIEKRCLRGRYLKGKGKWRNKEKSRNGRAHPSYVRLP